MRFLLRLLWIPVIALLGWAGWWWVGAQAQEQALAAWFAERREAGWQADYAALEVEGFPRRFERQVTDLRLADPDNGWSLAAPWIASASGTFAPNRFDVSVAPDFTVAVPGERAQVTSARNRLALAVAPLPSMPLRDFSVDIAGLELSGEGWRAGAGLLQGRIAEKSDDSAPPDSYDLTLEAEDVVLPAAMIAQIDPTGRLSPEFDRLTLDAHATLDHTLDRDFVEQAELSARTIVLRRAAFKWGQMALDASGRLDADEQGYAEGKIALSVTNWRQMLRLAEDSGAIGREIARAVETALELASLFGSRDGALDVSLRFGDGRISIGPLSIGDAPRISLPPRSGGA